MAQRTYAKHTRFPAAIISIGYCPYSLILSQSRANPFGLYSCLYKVLSLVSCSVSLHTRSAVHSCLAISTFPTPRNLSVPQPVSPGLSPHARSRIPCHLSCGYVTYPNCQYQSRLVLLVGQVTHIGHACHVWRNLSATGIEQ